MTPEDILGLGKGGDRGTKSSHNTGKILKRIFFTLAIKNGRHNLVYTRGSNPFLAQKHVFQKVHEMLPPPKHI